MLRKLPEDGCEPRLSKSGNAQCHFIKNNSEIIELLNDNIILVTNFNGFLAIEKDTRNIRGTFIV